MLLLSFNNKVKWHFCQNKSKIFLQKHLLIGFKRNQNEIYSAENASAEFKFLDSFSEAEQLNKKSLFLLMFFREIFSKSKKIFFKKLFWKLFFRPKKFKIKNLNFYFKHWWTEKVFSFQLEFSRSSGFLICASSLVAAKYNPINKKLFSSFLSGSREHSILVDFGRFYASFLAQNDFIKMEMKFNSKLHHNC
jgi:hypothetical protein